MVQEEYCRGGGSIAGGRKTFQPFGKCTCDGQEVSVAPGGFGHRSYPRLGNVQMQVSSALYLVSEGRIFPMTGMFRSKSWNEQSVSTLMGCHVNGNLHWVLDQEAY